MESEVKVEENGISIAVAEGPVPNVEADVQSETADSESDSDSESVTTEVSDCDENKVEHVLPEIKINLAEAEEEEVEEPKVEESESNTCDKSFGDDLDFIDDEDNSVEEKPNTSEEKDPGSTSTQVVNEEGKKGSPLKRRPSLLKTVVSIKSDQPVTVVNYTETLDAETEKKPSSPKEEILNASLAEMEDSFQTTEGGLDSSKDVFESFNNTMEESIVSLADASIGETSTETECLNSGFVEEPKQVVVSMQESVTTGSEESDSGQVIVAQKEEPKPDNHGVLENNATVEDECGNLLIVEKNGLPQTAGENETSTDLTGKPDKTEDQEPQDNITDIYRVTNANEKIDRLANHQQHNSNMIHDLIIGRSKQRRVRQPRVTAPLSLVPSVPPSSSPPKENNDGQQDGEAPQTPVRDKSLSRGFREGSLSRSIREGSVGRSIREGSPKITQPPTPITNPEKFGIKVAEREQRKAVGSLSSLISPTDSTESQDATDNMDGIISAPVSPAKSGRESNLSNTSNGKGKGRGFLSTVAGIFKTSSASPSPTASPSHQTKPTKEDSFLGRFSRKDGAKKRDEDVRELVTRTASLAMQASHPSTPPVPLSRRIKLGSQPPQT